MSNQFDLSEDDYSMEVMDNWVLLFDDDDHGEHNIDKMRRERSYEYREEIKIEKNNDNYDDLISREEKKHTISNSIQWEKSMRPYQHNYSTMDNDDQKSRIINGKQMCWRLVRENWIEFTSIQRSQMEQCEQRGGRNNRHVRQYFK